MRSQNRQGHEKKLQMSMVMDFSQKCPEKNGQLFSVRNTTFSVRDGQTQKAMGMKAGVADLIFFEDIMTGIEVKAKGSNHDREHIENQYIWGETITRNGGEYYMVTSLEGFWSIVENGELHEDVYTLEMIKEKLDAGTKGIKF